MFGHSLALLPVHCTTNDEKLSRGQRMKLPIYSVSIHCRAVAVRFGVVRFVVRVYVCHDYE